ncbi:MAG: hypothetical protein ABH885_05705, partial [Candidatus Omnitrophota bacterium]
MKKRIAIVGGDERVISLIDILKGMDGIEITAVCDADRESPAMRYARSISIKASTDLANTLTVGRPDIIIETSGSKEFLKVLHHITDSMVKVVDSNAAELLINIAREKESAKKRGEMYLVKKISGVFAAGYDTHNVTQP